MLFDVLRQAVFLAGNVRLTRDMLVHMVLSVKQRLRLLDCCLEGQPVAGSRLGDACVRNAGFGEPGLDCGHRLFAAACVSYIQEL